MSALGCYADEIWMQALLEHIVLSSTVPLYLFCGHHTAVLPCLSLFVAACAACKLAVMRNTLLL